MSDSHDEKTPIRLHAVSYALGGQVIIDRVNFSLGQGNIIALTGENGSGKSTLCRIVMGSLVPDAGEAFLFGTNARHFKDWKRIGYVQQLPPAAVLRHPATALEIVQASCPRTTSLPSHTTAKEHALYWLAEVGMQAQAHQVIGSLSGGQLQRVRLAAALTCDPDLLVLDEPTTGLDAQSTEAFCTLIQTLRASRQLSILLVTHDRTTAQALDAQIVRLENGCLHAEADAEDKKG